MFTISYFRLAAVSISLAELKLHNTEQSTRLKVAVSRVLESPHGDLDVQHVTVRYVIIYCTKKADITCFDDIKYECITLHNTRQ